MLGKSRGGPGQDGTGQDLGILKVPGPISPGTFFDGPRTVDPQDFLVPFFKYKNAILSAFLAKY